MDQIKQLLNSLSLTQKVSIGTTLLLIGAGIMWLVSWKKESDFKPVYTGMTAEDAGSVIQKLKESGGEYRLAQNGTTILVPSARVDELRVVLARDGLPKSGRIGFEIFDKTNFGLTDFAEHVNYRRALEGELERTIMSLAEVERARVHLTFPKESVFVESRAPAKASVLVNLRGAKTLPQTSVGAITHLVASAVEGLDASAVSVVDRQGRLLSRPRLNLNDDGAPNDALLEYRERMERNLVAKLNQALEPVVGASRFRAGVSVDCDTSTTEESEETLDPANSAMLTTQKAEETSGGSLQAGVPGTQSNLPRPAPRSGGATATTRRTENTSFQTSRKVRHVRQPKGNIIRMSVAVLVDHNIRWEQGPGGMRRVVEPPAPETLKAIREIASAVVGLNTERGDQITVEALPFESTLTQEPPASQPEREPGAKVTGAEWLKYLQDPKNLRNLGAGALLIALIAAMLFYLRRNQRKLKAELARRALPAPQSVNNNPLAVFGGAPQKVLNTGSEAELAALMGALKNAVQNDSIGAAGALRTWLVAEK